MINTAFYIVHIYVCIQAASLIDYTCYIFSLNSKRLTRLHSKLSFHLIMHCIPLITCIPTGDPKVIKILLICNHNKCKINHPVNDSVTVIYDLSIVYVLLFQSTSLSLQKCYTSMIQESCKSYT